MPVLFILFLTWWGASSLGSIQYAARYNVVNCSACHWSPVGGGPKTPDGKRFQPTPFTKIKQPLPDALSADVRLLYHAPEKSGSTKGGMGVMSVSLAANIELDDESHWHWILEHNVAGFAAAPYRDTYLQYRFHPKGVWNWFDSVMVGRLRIPFGIVIDEHRTYTRIQTATEWFTMDVGAVLSGTPSSKFHYDIAIVNGEKSAGQTLNSGQAVRWGGVLNVRWMPSWWMLGSSASYSHRAPANTSAQAFSLYGVASIARLTEDRIPLIIMTEATAAWGWNAHLGQGFAADANYVQGLARAQSRGALIWIEYALNERLSAIYKYDLLIPDRDFMSDLYERHGVGLRWRVVPHLLFQVRNEWARATHPTENQRQSLGAQDGLWTLLQFIY